MNEKKNRMFELMERLMELAESEAHAFSRRDGFDNFRDWVEWWRAIGPTFGDVHHWRRKGPHLSLAEVIRSVMPRRRQRAGTTA